MCRSLDTTNSPENMININITNLPSELLLLIIDYAYDDEDMVKPSSFASVNRYLSDELLRKTRRIKIKTDNRKWISDEKRSKLLQLIDNPYHQLSVISRMDSASDISDITSQLDGLQSFHVDDSANSWRFLSILSNHINTKGFKLKELIFRDLKDVECLPPIPCLEKLYLQFGDRLNLKEFNLPAFRSLSLLHLFNCANIEDVSCLDGIHDLKLDCCRNIRDISGLNNNYRVYVGGCERISTYSKSFCYSRNVTIIESRSDFTISLGNCCSLKTLSISGTFYTYVSLDIRGMLFSSLSSLSLYKVANINVIPPNRLHRVSISHCPNFNSVENMENIPSIHLEGLDNITSLTGPGPEGRVGMKLIEKEERQDITSLKESFDIKMHYSPLLLTHRSPSVLHVKVLIIPERCYHGNCDQSFISLVLMIEKVQDLKGLTLSFPLAYDRISYLVFSLKDIIKFVLSLKFTEEDEKQLDEDKYIQEKFFVRKIKQDSKLYITWKKKI